MHFICSEITQNVSFFCYRRVREHRKYVSVSGWIVENGAAHHTLTVLPLFRWLPGARLFVGSDMRWGFGQMAPASGIGLWSEMRRGLRCLSPEIRFGFG